MSIPFELFFHARQDAVPSEESLIHYFEETLLCSRMPVEDQELGIWFSYENTATGVNCSFYLERDCNEPADYTPPGYTYPGISFRMSTGRPSFFALEAMPLVVALCNHFDLLVDDPQEETVAPPDQRDLIRSWMKVNLVALAELQEDDGDLVYVPMEKLLSWWRYTCQEETGEAIATEGIFVPYLLWSRDEDGRGVTMMSWDEGAPTLFPVCDYIHIQVEEPGALGMTKRVNGIARYDEVMTLLRPYLADYQTPIGIIPALRPGTDAPLGRIIEACRTVSPEMLYMEGAEPSMLCDIDLSAAE